VCCVVDGGENLTVYWSIVQYSILRSKKKVNKRSEHDHRYGILSLSQTPSQFLSD
jgi:hypothetical protein